MAPLSEPGTTRYRTFLRNPQRNLGVFFRIESATVDGDEIRFANGDGAVMVVGRSMQPGERFTLLFPRFGETLDFTRRSRHERARLLPSGGRRRVLRFCRHLSRPGTVGAPPRLARPASTSAPLARLVGSISGFEPNGLRQPYIHGLLLAHRGKLVVEEYFHGHHRDMTHDSRSAGKSLTSALLGIAIHKGALAQPRPAGLFVFRRNGGLRQPRPPQGADDRSPPGHHVVGFRLPRRCNYDNPGNEDIMQSQDEQPDWYRYALDLPMIREPGEAGVYCTAGINLIGGVLRKATGISLPRFFHEELAEPLDIPYYQMNLSPNLPGLPGRRHPPPSPRLPEAGTALSRTAAFGRASGSSRKNGSGRRPAPHASLNESDDYGFAWWRRSYEVGGETIDTYYASGNGGQLLFVVPALDLVAHDSGRQLQRRSHP